MATERLSEIPATVARMIEIRSGPILESSPVTGGLNSEIAAHVRTETQTLFVKGLRTSNPRAWTQTREAAINPFVHGLSPRMVWQADDDAWHLLAFEYTEGRHANWKPGSDDLEPVLDVMQELAGRPLPPLQMRRFNERMAGCAAPDELHHFDGSALLHTDWNPQNVLITDGGVRLVDWGWVSLGAAWIDPALWVLWLIAAGHDPEQAEYAAAGHEAWRQASYEALAAFSRAQLRLWDSIADQSSTDWARPLQQAATTWRDYRN